MIFLKNICATILLSIFAIAAVAQSGHRVKDKSSKKAPEWSGGMQKNYIITSAFSDNIEKAKQICMEAVKIQIIEAVALNIKSSSENSMSQVTVNNDIESFLHKFSTTAKTQAANIPYLSSISSSKVEDYYWEKIEDKETKQISYFYSIKYPFSEFELKKLIKEFEEQNMLMEDKLKAIEKDFINISVIEDISTTLRSLQTIKDFFFDDLRKNQAEAVKKQYQSFYDQISIQRVSDKLGEEEYALVAGNKTLSYSRPPKVRSNTAYELETSKKDSLWEVRYNYSTCYPDEENYITISWLINGKTIKGRFNIKLEEK